MAVSTRHHRNEAGQAQTIVTAHRYRTTVAHIGPMHLHHTFAWASRQAMSDTSTARIVLSLCADLPPLHYEAISLADEVLVLNLAGAIDTRTLHELCAAYNQHKTITWLEDWPMYCPACGCTGPEAIHFFHNVLSLRDLNMLLKTVTAEHLPYLSGQLADWYGQVVPVVLLSNGNPALQVDLTCPQCERFTRVAYATAGEYGAWVTLLDAEGMHLVDLCDADERDQALLCAECVSRLVQPGLATAGIERKGHRYG